MNMIKKIRRRIETYYKRKNTFNAIRRLGGVIWNNTKYVNQGSFRFGRKVTIVGEGIDNVTRSQIVILKMLFWKLGIIRECHRFLSPVSRRFISVRM